MDMTAGTARMQNLVYRLSRRKKVYGNTCEGKQFSYNTRKRSFLLIILRNYFL